MVPSQGQGYIGVSRRPPDVEDYIDIVRRYRSWIIGPVFAGLVVSVVAAFLWPDTFVSSAVMRITPPAVPDRLVPSNVNLSMAERLNQMRQEILSRGSLTELIQRPSLDLYKKDRGTKPMEDVVEMMRKDIRLGVMESSAGSSGRRTASAFQIGFSYPERYKAQAVVRELVTKFTEQNVAVLRQGSSLTTSFLNDELTAAQNNLNRLDKEITQFRMENAGRLPDQLQSNLTTMNALQSRLASIGETVNRNSQEKMALETQLQNLRSQLSFYSNLTNETSAQQSRAAEVKSDRLIQLNRAILEMENALASARERYKEDYPDVRALMTRVASLKADRDKLEKEELEQQSQQQQQADANAAKVAEAARRQVSPQVQKALEDIRGNIATTETQIRAKELDIKERVKQQAEVQAQIQAYQNRIDVSPINEQHYTQLMRDYALAKEKYDEMSKKKGESETAQAIDERKAGENLEVLDPASLPESPTEPNRLVIATIGTGIGFVIGVFLAGARELKDTSLKNLKDVRAYTNLAVLSSIPLLENALLVRRKRRLFWLAWTSAVIIGTIAMSGSMYYYYFGRT
jgi:capsular polysaccharide biosynthesis protein